MIKPLAPLPELDGLFPSRASRKHTAYAKHDPGFGTNLNVRSVVQKPYKPQTLNFEPKLKLRARSFITVYLGCLVTAQLGSYLTRKLHPLFHTSFNVMTISSPAKSDPYKKPLNVVSIYTNLVNIAYHPLLTSMDSPSLKLHPNLKPTPRNPTFPRFWSWEAAVTLLEALDLPVKQAGRQAAKGQVGR